MFQRYYDNLVAVLPVSIGPKFVSEEIITLSKHNEIRGNSPNDVIMTLLEQVSSPLENGDVGPFGKMLCIMESHGTEAVRKLAKKITKDLNQGK